MKRTLTTLLAILGLSLVLAPSRGAEARPDFLPGYYTYLHPDIFQACGNDEGCQADHWARSGIAEGRSGSPAYDPVFYVQKHPDLHAAFCSGPARSAVGCNWTAVHDHWIRAGIGEGRQASSALDPVVRLFLNPGLGSHAAAVEDWVTTAHRACARGSHELDPDFYLRTNAAALDPVLGPHNCTLGVWHWVRFGARAGLRGAAGAVTTRVSMVYTWPHSSCGTPSRRRFAGVSRARPDDPHHLLVEPEEINCEGPVVNSITGATWLAVGRTYTLGFDTGRAVVPPMGSCPAVRVTRAGSTVNMNTCSVVGPFTPGGGDEVF